MLFEFCFAFLCLNFHAVEMGVLSFVTGVLAGYIAINEQLEMNKVIH